MATNRTIEFFEAAFQKRVAEGGDVPSSFEEDALPFLSGRVLDLGCGLGNLALAAARNGCEVTAVDASPTAIEYLGRAAREEGLAITAIRADVEHFDVEGPYDAVAAVGLLMFFPREVALRLLDDVQRAIRPGGCAAVTVLLEGTTFERPFDLERRYLFPEGALERAFDGWELLVLRRGEAASPDQTVRKFETVVARKRG